MQSAILAGIRNNQDATSSQIPSDYTSNSRLESKHLKKILLQRITFEFPF